MAKVKEQQTHLSAIQQRTQIKLEALQVPQQIEKAKQTLTTLETKAEQEIQKDANIPSRMQALMPFINEYSQRARRAITDITQEKVSQSEV